MVDRPSSSPSGSPSSNQEMTISNLPPPPRPSIYPLIDPKYPLFGTIYPYLRVQGGSWLIANTVQRKPGGSRPETRSAWGATEKYRSHQTTCAENSVKDKTSPEAVEFREFRGICYFQQCTPSLSQSEKSGTPIPLKSRGPYSTNVSQPCEGNL